MAGATSPRLGINRSRRKPSFFGEPSFAFLLPTLVHRRNRCTFTISHRFWVVSVSRAAWFDRKPKLLRTGIPSGSARRNRRQEMLLHRWRRILFLFHCPLFFFLFIFFFFLRSLASPPLLDFVNIFVVYYNILIFNILWYFYNILYVSGSVFLRSQKKIYIFYF